MWTAILICTINLVRTTKTFRLVVVVAYKLELFESCRQTFCPCCCTECTYTPIMFLQKASLGIYAEEGGWSNACREIGLKCKTSLSDPLLYICLPSDWQQQCISLQQCDASHCIGHLSVSGIRAAGAKSSLGIQCDHLRRCCRYQISDCTRFD